jgi:hypothetical protein
MKRSVIVSLAAVAAGASLALGQSVRQGDLFVTETATPRPSVIRVDTPQPPRPAPVKAKPAAQKQQPVQQTSYSGRDLEIEPVRPDSTPAAKTDDPPAATMKMEMLPAPKVENSTPIPAVVGDGHDGPTYSTDLIGPVFPWTKCGKRACGTVYIETPYAWIDARYLFGWFKKDQSPPLATTGPAVAANPGALDDPQTTVLFDGKHLHDQPYNGGYFTAGGWFDECQYFGGELGYFFFAEQDHGYITNANGFPGTAGLYQPFFNPLTGTEDVFVVAQQGDPNGPVSGSTKITSQSRLQGADGHFLFSFCRGMSFRCDAIAGVRWLGLEESLTIEDNMQLRGPFAGSGVLLPATVAITDRFSTRNDFIGGDFGLKSHFVNNCWSLDLLTRVALGGNHQVVRGDGLTGISFLGFPIVNFTRVGRFIGPANSGVFGNDIFSVVPEVGLTLGYAPTHWCKFTIGYNWMYWTNVVRPGGQVDRVVNPIGVPTRPEFQSNLYEPRRPGVGYNETDIWLQAITVGMQFTF